MVTLDSLIVLVELYFVFDTSATVCHTEARKQQEQLSNQLIKVLFTLTITQYMPVQFTEKHYLKPLS